MSERANSPSSTAAIAERLLDQRAKEDERQDRAHREALEHLAAQATLWQRTALALILVLLVLVAGVVGVGVTGSLPGVGDIQITRPGGQPEPATGTP